MRVPSTFCMPGSLDNGAKLNKGPQFEFQC